MRPVMAAQKDLAARVRDLPRSPGVYLFRGGDGAVLYVGKASSLRDRVRSYFQKGRLSLKVRLLLEEARDLETIVTGTEEDALVLEDALVKKHRPRFNTKLRDDKRYPYLKITAELFPRVLVVRRPAADGARYFGPFTSSRSMRRVLKLAHKLFPIRTCNLPLGEKRYERPCLLYHIDRCSGPCAGLVSPEEYRRAVDAAAHLFEGRVERVVEDLALDMVRAASEERFEHAARLRDTIQALERIRERQAVALPDPVDLDAVAVAVSEERGHGTVLVVRGGRLIGREGFPLALPPGSTPEEALEEFLDQYYTRATAIPPEVLVPVALPETEALAAYLAGQRGGRVHVGVPRSPERRAILKMAERNAALALRHAEKVEILPAEEEAVDELGEALALSARPWRIEAFDISNLQGGEATGSMVVFVGGRPRRDAYRKFRVRISGKPDDYAMMAEVLRRRLRHGLSEIADPTVVRGRFSDLPDLILVDGGKGQLGVAERALAEVDLGGIEVAALAKREELVYVPGRADPIRLPRGSPALRLLQEIRDEAHRFAIEYHRKLREKRALGSLLDSVPGVGPKRKATLLARFGSVDGLRRATLEELLSVPGLPQATAELLYKALRA
ncbi:MAG: Excinuclease ABC subunit C [Candidatus Bipolaricaulis sibiricus]|uniref:UvrABC system protein C n=1 Tax=Bipolaricaulis sibiricus TaxID=2501609 RepID=A0A410FRT9_BIPS1|nr:MAG: Excinuclease ABC subunit C [Candidatus Bipolaricaulis sibiricus]